MHRLTRSLSLAPASALLALAGACAAPPPAIPAMAGAPNPASAHCVRQGGDLIILRDADGAAYGVCLLQDGRECEEWTLFRDNRCIAPTSARGAAYE